MTGLPDLRGRMAPPSDGLVDNNPSRSAFSVLAKTISGILAAGATLGSLIAAAAWLVSIWWPFELLAHFHGSYGVVLLPLAIACFVARRRGAAMVALVVGLADLAVLLPLYQTPEGSRRGADTASAAPHLTVLSANVNSKTSDLRDLVALVTAQDPDLVALQEVSRTGSRTLSPLRARYPFHIERPRDDTFGISFYSKWPILDAQAVDFIPDGTLSTVVYVQAPIGKVLVINTHPIRPGVRGPATLRDTQLRAIGSFIQELGDTRPPVVVVGDLNTSSWTQGFRDVCELGGLTDSRLGFGVQATWPSPILPLGTAIDHVLVSEHWDVVERQVLPPIGSDHAPIVAGMNLKRD